MGAENVNVAMLYGISHGFDITHNFLVMDWHFKDILWLVVLLLYRSCTRFL